MQILHHSAGSQERERWQRLTPRPSNVCGASAASRHCPGAKRHSPSHHHPERLPHGHRQFRSREHLDPGSKPAAEKQVDHDTFTVVPGPRRSHPGRSGQPQRKGGRRRTRAHASCGAPPPLGREISRTPGLGPPLDYGSILQRYREGHRALPGPHPWLGRREGVLLGQLQTGTVLTPALARHACPGLYESAKCSICARELATLTHVLWGCDACAGGVITDALPPGIVNHISSPDHEAQLNAIQRLDAALARQKRTEQTPSSSRWACRR
ncbi:hypothetical protein HPB51_024256 [Rhipicephalus microplus]|uniref:Tick transposon n=1 Tax=Rhipicephalus microplus TaxID=6941 RepID=A0A9J6DX82_RHIMP|nr:hypothetical protein HPB51_024256 [Rhipicephalus microplus]